MTTEPPSTHAVIPGGCTNMNPSTREKAPTSSAPLPSRYCLGTSLHLTGLFFLAWRAIKRAFVRRGAA